MTTTAPTIATLQTPPGKGGIAVITLTGPGAKRVADEIFYPHTPAAAASPSAEESDILQLGFLRDEKEKLDQALLSQSRDGFEINIHGGSAVARRVLRRLSELGASVTNPEQTDIFDPVHPHWHNPAIGQEMLVALPAATGLLATSALAQQWSAGLSKLAREALDAMADTAADNLKNLEQKLRQAADAFGTMQRLLHPAEVVLAGPPNAGKSTLGNLLIGRPVSIVHDIAGTTRDWVRELAIINGVAVWLTDTAGLWESTHDIDAEAVRRAWQRIEQANLVLLTSHNETIDLPEHIHAKGVLHVATKIDITPNESPTAEVGVSAITGEGIDNLKAMIIDRLGLKNIDPRQPMAFTQRQATLLINAADALDCKDQTACKDILRQLLE